MVVRLPYRLRQVATLIRTNTHEAPIIPINAQELLTEPMLHQFRILPLADQRHLLSVFQLLQEMGADRDTQTAGLIHDVGKACAKCRITVFDRGMHVILQRIVPGPYRRFAAIEIAPTWIRGLHRLANHATRGALAAEQAGYSSRVTYLVRHHERGGEPGDKQLILLRVADEAAGSS